MLCKRCLLASIKIILMNIDSEYCMICGSAEFGPVCEKSDFRYVGCARCRSVRQYPYPSDQEIAGYYADYQTKKSGESVYLTDAGYACFKRDKAFTFADLGLGDDAFAGKTVLDVGCGTGQFLQMMGDFRAASVLGMDISQECIDQARERELNCVCGDFLSLDGRYDVISMWHLIEHLRDPCQYIAHAYRLLNPGGWLLIETPVVGVISESFGADWRFFMPVEHINLFSQDALFCLGAKVGLDLRSWIRFGSGNTSGSMPAPNKRAMDIIAKKHGFGDTLAALFVK